MDPPPDSLYARGFAADAETERALRAGLAGREVRIQRGRFETALQRLAAESSPRLVFVDLDGVADPESAARELTAVCAFGTTLIAFGSTDTADYTRRLLRQGIADYLVKPVSAAAVREASATALGEAPERLYAGRVVVFTGTAGCGVSTLIAAIARSVANGGRMVSAVDLDPVSGTLGGLLGATPTGDLPALFATLDSYAPDGSRPPDHDEPIESDSVLSPEQLDGICSAANAAGISLVAYRPVGPVPETPSAATIHTLLAHLANRAHVVLVTGVLDPESRASLMQQADARVLLYEPALPSISAAVHCLTQLGPEYSTILVQSHPRMRRSALTAAQIRYALAERRPDVVIPFDPALHAAATGEARDRAPGKRYREALRQLIERAVEGPAPVSA